MRKQYLSVTLFSLTLVLLLSMAFAAGGLQARGRGLQVETTPQWISYQGFLTDDSGLPVEGVKDMTFRILPRRVRLPRCGWKRIQALR